LYTAGKIGSFMGVRDRSNTSIESFFAMDLDGPCKTHDGTGLYSKIPEADFPENSLLERFDTMQTERKSVRRTNYILALVIVVLAGSIIMLVSPLFSPRSRVRSTIANVEIEYRNCGSSSAEARRRGCIMDVISRTWHVPQCYDAELAEEFINLKDWHWYTDTSGKTELSRAEVERGDGPDPFYVTREYHLLHCQFVFRKLQRAIQYNTPVDSYMGNYNHTKHCSLELWDHWKTPEERQITDSPFILIYPTCPVPIIR
jgi:hypothetical protein